MIHESTDRSTGAFCSQCGTTIGPGDRFCPACGAVQGVTCPSCGALASGTARVCPDCGGPLPVPRPLLSDVEQTRSAARWSGRGFRLLVGAAACLLIVLAAVAWIYFSAPERQREQPISRVAAAAPLTLAIRPGTPSLALIGTPSGVLVSVDQGMTWQQMLLEGGVRAIGAGPSDASPVYLAGAHLWRGEAHGFQQVTTDLPVGSIQALAVDPSQANRVYAVVAGRGLYRSDDAGQHWVPLGSEVPSNVTSLALVGSAHPLFFAGTSQQGIFASDDGRAWANASGFVNGALPTQDVLALAYDPRSGDRYVSPTGETLSGALYAGTNAGLFKSIDEGRSWASLPFHRPISALAVSPAGDHLMLAVDLDGNIYRSRDGGVTWR